MFGSKRKLPRHVRVADVRHVLKVVDTLLGELPDEKVDAFSKSEDFALYEHVMERVVVSYEKRHPGKAERTTMLAAKPLAAGALPPKPAVKEPAMSAAQSREASSPSASLAASIQPAASPPQAVIPVSAADIHAIEEELEKRIEQVEKKYHDEDQVMIKDVEARLEKHIDELAAERLARAQSPVQSSPPPASVVVPVQSSSQPAADSGERKSGLLNLDSIKAKIDQKVKERMDTIKAQGPSAAAPQPAPVQPTPSSPQPASAPVQPSPTRPIANDADIPDMAKVKAKIMAKLHGGKA